MIITSLYGINLLGFAKEFVLCEVRNELYEYSIINFLKSHNRATVCLFVCLMRLMAGQVHHSPFCFWVEIKVVTCANYMFLFQFRNIKNYLHVTFAFFSQDHSEFF